MLRGDAKPPALRGMGLMQALGWGVLNAPGGPFVRKDGVSTGSAALRVSIRNC